MLTEFKATHYWKQYPGIKFQVNWDDMKIRVKGDNDTSATRWVQIKSDRNGVLYFTVKRERIYWFNVAKL